MRAEDRRNDKGLYFGFVIGALVSLVISLLTLGTRSDIVLDVAQPTIVYGDDRMAQATGSYVAVIEDLQAGVNETAIAEQVRKQISELNLALREDIATAVAQNLEALESRLRSNLESSPTHAPYVGGENIATPIVACDIIEGC